MSLLGDILGIDAVDPYPAYRIRCTSLLGLHGEFVVVVQLANESDLGDDAIVGTLKTALHALTNFNVDTGQCIRIDRVETAL